MNIRNYTEADYMEIESLYKEANSFGGQFDEARDSAEKLKTLTASKSDAILVAEEGGKVMGTVTLFEDGRSAWLYRFAVAQNAQSDDVAQLLYDNASSLLKGKGHTQVLVYAPVGDKKFENRYTKLGFNKGHDFTAYWQDLK